MNYQNWKDEFKKYLYLLPPKEEKDTLAYFDEQYKKFENDEEQLNSFFSSPKEKASFVVADYLEEKEEIKKEEEKELLKEAKSEDEKSALLFFTNIGSNVGDFFDSFSMQTKKRKNILGKEECEDFENLVKEKQKELYEKRKKKAVDQRKERILKEEKNITDKSDKNYNDDILKEDISKKYYTRAQRHSKVTNFLYGFLMGFGALIGIVLVFASVGALVMTVISTMHYFLNNPAVGGQLLVDVGYIILIFGSVFLSFGISLGIAVGSIKNIHKRFFVKQYIMLKKQTF